MSVESTNQDVSLNFDQFYHSQVRTALQVRNPFAQIKQPFVETKQSKMGHTVSLVQTYGDNYEKTTTLWQQLVYWQHTSHGLYEWDKSIQWTLKQCQSVFYRSGNNNTVNKGRRTGPKTSLSFSRQLSMNPKMSMITGSQWQKCFKLVINIA